jgi:predicted RNase H-related nuclease YkuK (DUF458 family)
MNKKILEGNFYNPTRGSLTLKGVVKELLGYITEKPDKFYDIIVGCDSSSDLEPHFPIAIVILRVGEGGRFFLKKIKYPQKKFYNFHQRVLEEVLLSCELALSLREELKGKIAKISPFPEYQFRYIHADIGEAGATKDMVKEVTGLIRGNGFEPKIKPEAYVASTVADRYS